MTTTTVSDEPRTPDQPRSGAPVSQVRTAGGTFSDDLRAVRIVWKREMIRFFRNRLRIVTGLVQPVLFLYVLGVGLGPLMQPPGGAGDAATSSVSFTTFLFPGIIVMTVLFTSVFGAMSIVWDREFGFLREMLVAPVRRGSLVVGKCLGGATVAASQAIIMLLLAPTVGVPYRPMLLAVVMMMVITALTLSAFGILIASRMQQMESFGLITPFVVMPLFFLSGAMFPINGLPLWMDVLAKINPLTYAVDPIRKGIFSLVNVPSDSAFSAGITWNGWPVPWPLEVGIVIVVGLIMLGVAIRLFSKID